MNWHATWDDPFAPYLRHFQRLIGDHRTEVTFAETVKGIIAAGSLVCHRIAAHSPVLATVQNGAQRVIRMVVGDSTKRSPNLDAAHLTAKLRAYGVAHLGTTSSDELWLIADGSELRKPHARGMPHLMRVKDLDGGLVNGYRTLNVLGITPNHRGVLYHLCWLPSSSTPIFFHAESRFSCVKTVIGCMRLPCRP